MKNKKISLLLLAMIISMIWVSDALSLSRPVHRDLNERIARRTINHFSLNDYLIKQLGFTKGVDDFLKKDSTEKVVWWWLGEGGHQEDKPEQ